METEHPQFSLRSVAQAAWKHKGAIVSVWVVISTLTILVVHALPRVYQAEALVLLESQRIPTDFVSPTTITADLWERLSSLDQRVLSHSQLLELIETFGLYREEAKVLSQEELVSSMRKDVSVTLEQGLARSDRPPAFRVAYSGSQPDVVARIANRLANLFIEYDLRTREVEASGTAQFLESQLRTAKEKLQLQEAQLSRYKLEHNGELPEQEVALLAALARLQGQLQANQDSVRQAQQEKFFTQRALEEAHSSERDLLIALGRVPDTEEEETDPAEGQSLIDPTRQELILELTTLRQRYTERHPEVLRAAEALRQYEIRAGERDDAPAAPQSDTGPDSRVDNLAIGTRFGPVHPAVLEPELRRRRDQASQLRIQDQSLDSRIEMLRSDQQNLQGRIASAEFQVQKLPIREQEIAGLVRDYEITKESYQSLLQKKMDADIAMEMEKHQKSERFVLLEPARVPTEPTEPQALLLALAGCGAGLLCGVLFGVGLELKKNVFLGEWELPEGFPVLARVPHFEVGTADANASANVGRLDGSEVSLGHHRVGFGGTQ